MLTVIWIVLLVLATVAFSYHAASTEQKGNKGDNATFAACSASICAVGLVWDFTGPPVYVWLDASLPQQGTGIHEFTAVILVFAAGFVLWVLPLAIGLVAAEFHQRLKARGTPAPRES